MQYWLVLKLILGVSCTELMRTVPEAKGEAWRLQRENCTWIALSPGMED